MVQPSVLVQTLEIERLMCNLISDSSKNTAFYGQLHRALRSIMTAVYGKRFKRVDHEDIMYSEQSSRLRGEFGQVGTFIEDESHPLARPRKWSQPSRRRALERVARVLWVKIRIEARS